MNELNSNLLELTKDLKKLIRLQRIKLEEELRYSKEWFPLFFLLGIKGSGTAGKYRYLVPYATSPYHIAHNEPIPFAYEFHSLMGKTQYRNYYTAVRLNINGVLYPQGLNGSAFTVVGDSSQYEWTDWEFQNFNYYHEREYAFDQQEWYQSGHGSMTYPFKLKVEKNWTLDFMAYSTTTSTYWCKLIINGWKLHPRPSDEIRNILEAE